MKQVLDTFLKGLITPSVPSVAIALSIVIGAVGFFCLRISPEWLADGGYRYFMTDGTSYDAHATGRALKLKQGHQDKPAVVVIGGSVTRESIPSEDIFAQYIGADLGESVDVYKLCTGAMTSWHMAAFADQIPDEFEGVVVIGLSMNRLSRSENKQNDLIARPRFGFVSKTMDDAARNAGIEVPKRTGIYLWDNKDFLLPRINRFAYRLVKGPVTGTAPLYPFGVYQDEEAWASTAEKINSIREEYDENSELNIQVTRQMIERLQARGIEFVFVKPPINPRYLAEEMDRETLNERWTGFQRLLDAYNVPLWDLSNEANLKASDFYDWAHLNNPETIERYGRLMSGRIADLMKSDRMEVGQ